MCSKCKMIYKRDHQPLQGYIQAHSPKVLIYTTQIKNLWKKVNVLSYKVNRILRVRANQYVPIQEVTAGDIVAFSGFK